jgi:hypothetical protein
MRLYKCEKCDKEFSKKSAYACHSMRVKPCIKNTSIDNMCTHCNKNYSNKYNLNKHLKTCKMKIDYDNQLKIDHLQEIVSKQEKDKDDLKKKVDELANQAETNTNITVNNTNTNTNSNNVINIYNAGKEDLSLLSKEDIIKICTSGTYYPIVAAEIIHCNKKYPEFQNFLISNLRSNTGLIKINDNWVSKSQEDILRTLLTVDKTHVSTLIKDLEVDKKLQVKLESTQGEVDTNENKEHQKSKIRQKLYDASKMIMKNKKHREKVSIN